MLLPILAIIDQPQTQRNLAARSRPAHPSAAGESVPVPVLVALERLGTRDTCPSGATYLVVGGEYEAGGALVTACAPGALETLRDWPSGSVYRCDRLATAPVYDPDLGEITPEQLVARRQLERP
jgi:hypothetical protein